MVPVADVLAWIASRGPIDGLTISGGEPFDQPEALEALIRGFRGLRQQPGSADVLVYSGYAASRLRRLHSPLFDLADAVVAGPYQAGTAGDARRGSGNQQIHTNTCLGRTRYGPGHVRRGLQAVTAGGSLWMIGIPREGDMERLESVLAERGVVLHDVSWRC
jgi:anaerobic ribonucleoside-triphosphate reductase activating protein